MIWVPLPFGLGGLVIPIANVTPRNADGTVQFTDVGHNLGPAVTVHGGAAIGLITAGKALALDNRAIHPD
ncbi:MAG: hypothetical protein WBL53_17125 [Pseudonocardiaceae bacterium]